jgi:hypothetical protein
MPWLKHWPSCLHVPGRWDKCQSHGGDRGSYEYRQTKCEKCGRPMVAAPQLPPVELRALRRHVAWWMLDKEYEHAGNTVVVGLEPRGV